MGVWCHLVTDLLGESINLINDPICDNFKTESRWEAIQRVPVRGNASLLIIPLKVLQLILIEEDGGRGKGLGSEKRKKRQTNFPADVWKWLVS